MTLSNLIKDPSPGVTPGDGSSINTDQWNKVVDGLSGDSTVWNHSYSQYTCLIYKIGSTYYAKSGIDGTLINSGDTNLDNVITSVKTYIGTGMTPTKANVIVEFGAGVFITTTGIDWGRGNITIKGQGAGVTQLQLSASAADSVLLHSINASNSVTSDALTGTATIGDITLNVTSNNGYTAGDYILLRANTVIDTEIGNRFEGEIHKIKSCAGTVITLGASNSFGGSVYNTMLIGATPTVDKLTTFYQNVTIQGIGFSDLASSRGAGLTQGQTSYRFIDGLIIKDCSFKDLWYSAIQPYQVLNTRIENCIFDHIQQSANNNWYGVEIRGSCQNVVVNGCSFRNMRHGITAGCGGAGTFVTTLCGRFKNLTYSNNTCIDTAVAHLDLHQGGQGCSITGNTCIGDDSSANGIQSRSPCNITGNSIEGIKGSGISLDSGTNTPSIGASGSVVSGNKVNGCTTGVILQGGVDKCIVNANILTNLSSYAIFLNSTASVISGSNSQISDNIIYGQTANVTGIMVDSSTGVIVTGNRITGGTSTTGLRLLNTNTAPTNCYFADNYLSAMGGTPFQFHASPSNTHIIKNNFGLSDNFTLAGQAVTTGTDILNTAGLSNITTTTVYTNRFTKKKVSMTASGTVTAIIVNGATIFPDTSVARTFFLEIGDTFRIDFTGFPTTTWSLL